MELTEDLPDKPYSQMLNKVIGTTTNIIHAFKEIFTPTAFRIIAKVLFLCFCGFIVLTALGIRQTEKPEFCKICHTMEPYYDAWKTSKHNKVPCIECHYEPGITSTVEGKFKAITQVAKYVTGTAGTKPWAEVSDRACLREGCHEKRLLRGRVDFNGIPFDHAPHLLELRRGKQLRCTSCHSQIVMGSHISVTTSTCFICHFKNYPPGQALGGCRACHTTPPDNIKIGNTTYNHSTYLNRGIDCGMCHLNVTDGKGVVPRERCLSCHNKKIERYDDAEFMHQNHVTKHKVECFDCHLVIRHGAVVADEERPINCIVCHGNNTHLAQRKLYEGSNSSGEHKNFPNIMYEAKIDCKGCHIFNPNDERSHFVGKNDEGTSIACIACHGPKFYKMLDEWKKVGAEKLAVVESYFANVEKSLTTTLSKDKNNKYKETVKILDEAKYNINLVKFGKSIHNLPYSLKLLDDAVQKVDKAKLIVTGKTNIEIPSLKITQTEGPYNNCTALCHITPPSQDVLIGEFIFPHSKHINKIRNTKRKVQNAKRKDKAQRHRGTKAQSSSIVDGLSSINSKPLTSNQQLSTINYQLSASSRQLPCISCHSEKEHGKTLISKNDCVVCHKKRNVSIHPSGWGINHNKDKGNIGHNCVQCHSIGLCKDCHIAKRAVSPNYFGHTKCTGCHYESSWKVKSESQSCLECHRDKKSTVKTSMSTCKDCHKPHIWTAKSEKSCALCHNNIKKQVSQTPSMSECGICHTTHIWKLSVSAKCSECHEQSSSGLHKLDVHTECSMCHKPHIWKVNNRSTCEQCHSDKFDHNAPVFCGECHLFKS